MISNVQKFGVINDESYLLDVEGNQQIDYKKYQSENNLLRIDDDLIDEICINRKLDFDKMETFCLSLTRPHYGLAHYALTLIPPNSLKAFKDIIVDENIKYKSEELELLILKIDYALENKKYLIHFGI